MGGGRCKYKELCYLQRRRRRGRISVVGERRFVLVPVLVLYSAYELTSIGTARMVIGSR